MVRIIQRFRNVDDTADLSDAITLNASTSVTIKVANTSRIYFRFDNTSNKNVWLKLQAASVDDDKKGFFVDKGGYWRMPVDTIYTGEISAIADVGSPDVFYTEY